MSKYFKRIKTLFFKKKALKVVETAEAFQPKAKFEITLFSTFAFVLAALSLQFLISFQTRLLLRFYSISFTYNLFGIQFSSVDADVWPEDRIFLVYGFGLLFYFGMGILFYLWLNKSKRIHWKWRLILTWLAFLMVYSIPVGMLIGTFLFDGFGYAYSWLFGNIFIRGIVAIVAMALAIYNRNIWITLFLKAAYSASLISNGNRRRIYIQMSFIYPFLIGVLLIALFAIPLHAWAWLGTSLGLGLIVLPLFGNKISKRKYKVYRNDKKIFRLAFPVVQVSVVIILLWLANYFSQTHF